MTKKILISLVLLFCLWMIGLGVFNYKINHIQIDKETKTDAIVVLTGGRHRLTEAINLINNGMADKLFISGVQEHISLQDLEKKNAVKIIDGKEIILDKIATNTFENARETSSWIAKHKIASIRLVTSNYHMFRSLVEFRRWNKKSQIILHPVYSENVEISWWKSFYSFCFLASEYNKFIYAYFRAILYRV
jgi:uncharacterized SAM-binding protein YcdF (DUF218 family)